MTGKVFLAAVLVAASAALPVAQATEKHAANAATAQSDTATGEVRKVDKDAKKITIKHGPLAKLDMPAMTMVFQVKDPAMLESVKAGDKVRFQAEKVNGAFILTKIDRDA